MAPDEPERDPPPNVPGRLLYLTEPARAAVDFGLLASTAPLLAALPRGDGQPVLVLPGLGAADAATAVLRTVLARLGYRVSGWGLGLNVGPSPRVVNGVQARLGELSTRYDAAVSLVGVSLGGLYARQLARAVPATVRQVITLGSPVALRGAAAAGQTGDLSAFPPWPHFAAWARWYGRLQTDLPFDVDPGPLPVPTTSIYSVLDGIVGWRVCRNQPGPQAENIGVTASHLGFAHNPAVIFAIADRLAQPAADWHPFRPPALLRVAYRRS